MTYRYGNDGYMKLSNWRKAQNPPLTLADVAKRIDRSEAATSRYENGRVPEPDTMRRIHDLTGGAVTPNDFYDIPSGGTADTAEGMRS